jgi:integrase
LEILEQFKDEAYVEPRTVAFKDFAERWIEQRLSIRGSTASAYASVIKQHLIPYFGKTKLAKIRPAAVQRFVSQALKKGLSPKTVRNATILLRTMLASPKGFSAIQQGMIRYNPTAGVELPAPEHREILLITVKQAWKLINAASEFGLEAHGLVYLGAHTGMRRGEVLAVSFSDIDWDQKELLVSKGLSKFRTKEKLGRWRWKLGPTKSRKSRRRIGLDDEVIKVLKSLREKAPDPDGFIFCKPAGYPFDPDYFDELFDKIRKKAGLPDVRFHDLRHFFASMLIAQGESPKYVSDQLGGTDKPTERVN